MPIRINLLAEQHAAAEMRRRDPVKRATWAAGFVVGIMVVWSGYAEARLIQSSREVSQYEADWNKLAPSYKSVSDNLDKIAGAERKWAALQSLATNRFLWAMPLNALQYVMTNVDEIQITRLRTSQTYTLTEAVKPAGSGSGRPATSREKIGLVIDAKDFSRTAGGQITAFQQAITENPYFKPDVQKTRLIERSPLQTEPNNPAKSFVTFSLECPYPEKAR